MTSRLRALVVCPGRGSYSRATLGTLKERSNKATHIIDTCDEWRTSHDRPSVRELDAAKSFSSRRHVAGEHASLLTFACSVADAMDLHERFDVVGVTGNSMGWYTALAVAGALPLEDAVELVDTMGAYQQGHVLGAQLLYPITDKAWRPDPARLAHVKAAIQATRAAGHQAWWSIHLGSFAVLGADDAGAKVLASHLPEESRGPRSFPVKLPMHSAFHTPLLAQTSTRAWDELAHLRFQRPHTALVDGRGGVYRPLSADPAEIRSYTFGHQVVEMFDYTMAIRAALHHTVPDVVVLLGPGNSLGGPTAASLVAAGWQGVKTREAFEQSNAKKPLLLSFGLPEQAAVLR
jgi:malonyl CoA-acyl carrier protein transacylase